MKELVKTLKEWAPIFETRYKENLLDSVSSGDLINTMTSTVRTTGGQYSIVIKLNDYWYYVENGRKPGKFPPVDAMLEFIREKPIFPEPYTLPSGRQVVPTEMQLAYLVGRKIATEGYEGTKAFETTLDSLMSDFLESLRKAIIIDLKTEILN